jgi:hypothetical protein
MSRDENLFLDLLGKKSLETDLTDCPKSGFKPVDVLFRILDHMFQQVTTRKITDRGAVRDCRSEQFDVFTFESQIRAK